MRALRWIAAVVVMLAAAGAAFVYSGVYNVSATEQHLFPVYWTNPHGDGALGGGARTTHRSAAAQ